MAAHRSLILRRRLPCHDTGKGMVGGKNKVQAIVAHVRPAAVLAGLHRNMGGAEDGQGLTQRIGSA
jgi:hypothetical protein